MKTPHESRVLVYILVEETCASMQVLTNL